MPEGILIEIRSIECAQLQIRQFLSKYSTVSLFFFTDVRRPLCLQHIVNTSTKYFGNDEIHLNSQIVFMFSYSSQALDRLLFPIFVSCFSLPRAMYVLKKNTSELQMFTLAGGHSA